MLDAQQRASIVSAVLEAVCGKCLGWNVPAWFASQFRPYNCGCTWWPWFIWTLKFLNLDAASLVLATVWTYTGCKGDEPKFWNDTWHATKVFSQSQSPLVLGLSSGRHAKMAFQNRTRRYRFRWRNATSVGIKICRGHVVFSPKSNQCMFIDFFMKDLAVGGFYRTLTGRFHGQFSLPIKVFFCDKNMPLKTSDPEQMDFTYLSKVIPCFC